MAESKIDELTSIYSIKLKNKADCKSFVWRYFGTLVSKESDKVHDEGHVYCKLCLEDTARLH